MRKIKKTFLCYQLSTPNQEGYVGGVVNLFSYFHIPLLQVLSWYRRHIDQNWVFGLSCGNVDSETALKVYMYFENLVHCLAMYSGLVIICRLASLVGSLLYILMGMSVLIPVVFSTILLLLDMFITSDNKSLQSYQIGKYRILKT